MTVLLDRKQVVDDGMNVPGLIDRDELELLFDKAVEYITPGDIVAEIGSFKGRSSYVLATVCAYVAAEFHTIDPYVEFEVHTDPVRRAVDEMSELGPLGFRKKYLEVALEGLPVVYHTMMAAEAAPMFGNGSLRLLFIDGDHTRAAVLSDLANYWPKLMPGGVLIGHDYGTRLWEETTEAYDFFFSPRKPDATLHRMAVYIK